MMMTPQQSNIDTKNGPFLKGPVTFSKAHHFGALHVSFREGSSPLNKGGGMHFHLARNIWKCRIQEISGWMIVTFVR